MGILTSLCRLEFPPKSWIDKTRVKNTIKIIFLQNAKMIYSIENNDLVRHTMEKKVIKDIDTHIQNI